MSTGLSNKQLEEYRSDYEEAKEAIEEGYYENSATDLWRSWRGKIRALLDEVDRLRSENAELKQQLYIASGAAEENEERRWWNQRVMEMSDGDTE